MSYLYTKPTITPEQAKSTLINFKDRSFRQFQEQAINFITNSTKKVKVLKAPPGSGKSLTGVTAGIIKGNFTYLVESKYLQTQITNDFPNIKSIWGRNNYPCILDQSKSCAECVSTKKSPCPYIEDCLYRVAKEIAVQSPYRICNFQYFISEIMYAGKLRGKPFTIVDEADVMEKVLTSNVNLEFTERSLSRLGLTDGPKYKTTGAG
jgi:Rad3-related DNA helicase